MNAMPRVVCQALIASGLVLSGSFGWSLDDQEANSGDREKIGEVRVYTNLGAYKQRIQMGQNSIGLILSDQEFITKAEFAVEGESSEFLVRTTQGKQKSFKGAALSFTRDQMKPYRLDGITDSFEFSILEASSKMKSREIQADYVISIKVFDLFNAVPSNMTVTPL